MSDLEYRIESATKRAIGLNRRVALFGHDDCSLAARTLENFVAEELQAHVVDVLLVAIASAGAFGFRLSDGRDVFVKIHAGELSREQIRAVHDIQEVLRQSGLPAARRLRPLTMFRNELVASFHAFRDRGERRRAGQPGSVEAAAATLAKLDAVSPDVPHDFPRLLDERRNPIYRRTVGGPEPPEYADATRASGLLETVFELVRAVDDDLIVTHSDWAARNLRFAKGEVSSIFDFEALRLAPRFFSLGMSAVLFVNEPKGVANPADAIVRFIETYLKTARIEGDKADARTMDLGVAYAVARYLRGTVRSGHLGDEEAPDVFNIFMRKFRQRFGRDYTPLV